MQPEDFERLRGDLFANGYDTKQPIYTYEGAILDGWNRFNACQQLGITPIYKEFSGSTTDAIAFVMRTNKRRNLTSSQWAAIAVEAEEIKSILAAEATQRMLAGVKADPMELIPQGYEQNKTRTKLAATFNTNPKYINEAQRLKDNNPDAFEQIKAGTKTITEVKKEEKIEARKAEIEAIKQKIESEPMAVDGLFDVVVIDPPWAYEEKGGLASDQYDPQSARGSCPYPSMTVQQISEISLPVTENAVVFLWTTHAFLRDSFDLLDKWGLNYKATLVWDKEIIGMGRTVRMQVEFCLLAVKGKPIIQGASERDIIREKRREHSRKPDAFYSLVERMCIGRKLDYFSREERKNWYSYGAETRRFMAE